MVQLRHAIPARSDRRRTSLARRVALLGVAALCGCNDHAGRYIPLGEGMTWIYRETRITRNKGNAGAYEKTAYVAAATNLPEQKMGDGEVAPRLYADGTVLYFKRSTDGVALVASRQPGDTAPTGIAPRFLIKYPVKAGASWRSDGRTEVLTRTFLGGFGSITKPVYAETPLVFTVESVDDTVRVPAGTFQHCLRVHGTGTGSMLWGTASGSVDISVDVVQWYAPKVGLVREVRKEGTGPDGPLGGELTEELAVLKRPGWFR